VAGQPPIVAVSGRSGSGKTRLLSRLIPALAARGVAVGLLKHTRHEHAFDGRAEVWALGFEYDGMGKQTAVIHPDGTRVTQRNDKNGMVRQIDGIVDEVLYDARGLPVSVRYANGVHTTLAYEPGPGKVNSSFTFELRLGRIVN